MLAKTRFLATLCVLFAAGSMTARAATHRSFALVLDFSTCVTDPNNTNIITCQEFDASGKPAGQIKVTFITMISMNGTFMSWHERWDYTLEGGALVVTASTDWQGQALTTDESKFAPTIGFGKGTITAGTGKFKGDSGTITMRWDDNLCICLFDLIES